VLTPEQLDEIETLNARLFDLANSVAGVWWRVESAAEDSYLRHLNDHFPGKHVAILLVEVDRLNEEVERLKCDPCKIVEGLPCSPSPIAN
jgi:hypothetical protein